MMRSVRFLVLAPLLCVPLRPAQALEEGWRAVPTRPGVQVPCLTVRDPGAEPTRMVLLFAGGLGRVGPEALTNPAANFLVRSRALFVAPDIAAAVLDAPSDHADGMSDRFRMGPEHAEDIGRVMDFLQARFPRVTGFYLVGTSRGTLSAACAGRQLEGRLKGIVLTSEVLFSARPLKGATVPVLLVHHRHDGCKASAYRDAQGLARDLGAPLITVDGGSPPVTGPCEPGSPHGFWGREAETVGEILRWIRGEGIREHI
jgi:hypothetical protein